MDKKEHKPRAVYYILPMTIYILIPILFAQLNIDPSIAYVLRTTLVGALLILFFKHYKEIKFKASILSVVIGIMVFLLWIIASHYGTIPTSIPTIPLAYKYHMLIVRFIGAVFVAPLVEELFVRSYLIRALIKKKWFEVPIGKAERSSFLITTLFFGFAHNQILAGVIVGVIFTFLLYYKQNISDCIVAHAVANAVLYAYVIITGSYFLW